MKTTYWTVLIAAALLLPSHALADRVSDKLESGKILVISVPAGAGVRPGRAMGVVRASPELVMKILTNFPAYKDFVPTVVGSRKLSQGRYLIQCDLPWPINKIWVDVKVRSGKRKKMSVLQWKMMRGTLKFYEGTAWILPWKKIGTLLTYQMRAVPTTPAPVGLMNKGMRDAAEKVLSAVRQRAEKMLANKVMPGMKVVAQ